MSKELEIFYEMKHYLSLEWSDLEDLDIVEKSLKALEIIKNKELNIYFVKRLSLEDFNFQCRIEQQLTQEEYDLLKEVLS